MGRNRRCRPWRSTPRNAISSTMPGVMEIISNTFQSGNSSGMIWRANSSSNSFGNGKISLARVVTPFPVIWDTGIKTKMTIQTTGFTGPTAKAWRPCIRQTRIIRIVAPENTPNILNKYGPSRLANTGILAGIVKRRPHIPTNQIRTRLGNNAGDLREDATRNDH